MAASDPDSVTAYGPGSAANLGPGFDCLGVALAGMGDRVHASRSEAPGVRVGSVSDARVPTDAARNTAALAAACLGVVLYNAVLSSLAAGLLVLSFARRAPEPE